MTTDNNMNLVEQIAEFLRQGSDGVGGDWGSDEAADAVLEKFGDVKDENGKHLKQFVAIVTRWRDGNK